MIIKYQILARIFSVVLFLLSYDKPKSRTISYSTLLVPLIPAFQSTFSHF